MASGELLLIIYTISQALFHARIYRELEKIQAQHFLDFGMFRGSGGPWPPYFFAE